MTQPERIGRYRIVKMLGRGGFATVYLCEDRSLDDLVAVKLLAENQAADPESVRRFVAEARVMRNLRTPGVVTVHDVGEQDGRPYFVMEYCERGTLSERLQALGRPVTIDEGVGLANAISVAMSGLHGSEPPVVHRDIKPDNLLIRRATGPKREPVGDLLRPDEELIVGDFGLAKVVDMQSTKLSLIAYTRGFAPPEQVRGFAGIQPSADVYSASAVLIAALSGAAPDQVFADGDRAFSDEALAATGPLRANLQRGILFDGARRHSTIAEWATAIQAASVHVSQQPDPTRQVAPPSEPAGLSQALPSSGAPPTQLPPVAAPQFAPPASPPSSSSTPQPLATPEPIPSAPLPQAPVGADQNAGRSGRRGFLLAAGAAVIAVVAIGSLGVAQLRAGGPSIVGPTTPRVGEEAAFAVLDAEVSEWRVGSSSTNEPILLLVPGGPGTTDVRALTDSGELELSVDIQEADDGLRILGPGHLPLGETTVLSVDGTTSGDVTWTVAGESYRLDTLEVRPSESGTFEVSVATGDGQTGTRTFTVSPATG